MLSIKDIKDLLKNSMKDLRISFKVIILKLYIRN